MELETAIHSGDVYKLRAAISSVRGTAVDEKQLARAREHLCNLTKKADAQRALAAALASGDAEILAKAIQEAKARGLPKTAIAQAEAGLHSAKHTSVGGELHAAMEAGDISRLRMAAGAASDAGMGGKQVEAAWERIRTLESQEWALRELRTARESGVSARLQVAISHAEQAGVGKEELATAHAELRAWLSRSQAQQDLQLARASGSARVLRTALEAAKAAGVTGSMVSTAQAELQALERGGAWRPPPPSASPPPPPPGHDTCCDEDEGDEVEPEAPPQSAVAKLLPKTVSWAPRCGVHMLPHAQPHDDVGVAEFDVATVPPSFVSSGPPTDPQFHGIPVPPVSW